VLIQFYTQIRLIHILAVLLSGSLFALRGLLMLLRSRDASHPLLRYLSYAIDTTLLTAALLLVTMLHQYPFVHAWLTMKVLLLILYIVLGSLALKRGRTRTIRIVCYFAALLVFAFIVSVALTHNPRGVFSVLDFNSVPRT